MLFKEDVTWILHKLTVYKKTHPNLFSKWIFKLKQTKTKIKK